MPKQIIKAVGFIRYWLGHLSKNRHCGNCWQLERSL